MSKVDLILHRDRSIGKCKGWQRAQPKPLWYATFPNSSDQFQSLPHLLVIFLLAASFLAQSATRQLVTGQASVNRTRACRYAMQCYNPSISPQLIWLSSWRRLREILLPWTRCVRRWAKIPHRLLLICRNCMCPSFERMRNLTLRTLAW